MQLFGQTPAFVDAPDDGIEPERGIEDYPDSATVFSILGRERVLSVANHPKLALAVDAASARAVRNFQGSWIRNRVLNDRGRQMISVMILDLHFNENGGNGFTAAQLRRDAVRCDLCSPGRATAVLAAMRFGKLVEPAAGGDRRERRLAPSEALLTLHRERWATLFGAIRHIVPETAAAALEIPDEMLFGACTRAIMCRFRAGMRALHLAPEITPIIERDAGFAILCSLLTGNGGPVSIQALAAQFVVSRPHVSDILRHAESLGLATLSRARGGYVPGPALRSVITRTYIVLFSAFIAAYEDGVAGSA